MGVKVNFKGYFRRWGNQIELTKSGIQTLNFTVGVNMGSKEEKNYKTKKCKAFGDVANRAVYFDESCYVEVWGNEVVNKYTDRESGQEKESVLVLVQDIKQVDFNQQNSYQQNGFQQQSQQGQFTNQYTPQVNMQQVRQQPIQQQPFQQQPVQQQNMQQQPMQQKPVQNGSFAQNELQGLNNSFNNVNEVPF